MGRKTYILVYIDLQNLPFETKLCGHPSGQLIILLAKLLFPLPLSITPSLALENYSTPFHMLYWECNPSFLESTLPSVFPWSHIFGPGKHHSSWVNQLFPECLALEQSGSWVREESFGGQS